jgi:transcriptional regulator with XRE-family HTH domain
MLIGYRLRAIREARGLSQDDIEERTGMMRSFISRIENDHVVPAIESLEKFAHALDVPLYQLFYDGGEPPRARKPPKRKSGGSSLWGDSGKDAHTLTQFRHLLGQIKARDRQILLFLAQKMVGR